MPAVANVYTGAITGILNTSGNVLTASIGAEVDDARSYVDIDVEYDDNTVASNRWKRYAWRVKLQSNGASAGHFNEIEIERFESSYAKEQTVRWRVVEFEDAPESHNIINDVLLFQSADPQDVTLGDALTDASGDHALVLMSLETSASTLHGNDTYAFEVSFTSTTNMRLVGDGNTSSSVEFRYNFQVLEWTASEVEIQRGSINIATNNHSNTGTITSVDLDKSFVYREGWHSHAGSGIRRSNADVVLDNATTVRAQRYYGGSHTDIDVPYAVVEFKDGTVVETGSTAVANGSDVPTTQPTFTALSTSAVVFNGCPAPQSYATGTSAIYGIDFTFTAILNAGRDGVTLRRGSSRGDNQVQWRVIDWAGAVGSVVSRSLTGSGTLTVSADALRQFAAGGDNVGTLTSAADAIRQFVASQLSSGALVAVAAGNRIIAAQQNASGNLVMTASGYRQFLAGLSEAGVLTAAASANRDIPGALSGAGALTVAAQGYRQFGAGLYGAGALSGNAMANLLVSEAMTGTGALTVSADALRQFPAQQSADGVLTTAAQAVQSFPAQQTAAGALTATADGLRQASATLSVAGALDAAANGAYIVSESLTAPGVLTISADAIVVGWAEQPEGTDPWSDQAEASPNWTVQGAVAGTWTTQDEV